MPTTPRFVTSVRNDPTQPNFVWAPSPNDRRVAIRLFVDPDVIGQMADDYLNAGIGQYVGLVHGTFVPRDHEGSVLEEVCTGGLLKSVALFQGIERGMIDKTQGRRIYVYVTNPEHDYVYPERYSTLGPRRTTAPTNSVFTTFVDLDPELIAQMKAKEPKARTQDFAGIVRNWCWCLRSENDARLPADFDRQRYADWIW